MSRTFQTKGLFAASWAEFGVKKLAGQPAPRPLANETFVVGWTGMRGVITLAAAMSLPDVLNDGTPFPQLDILIFLSFCIILITLVAQGLSLPAVIRRLRLSSVRGETG